MNEIPNIETVYRQERERWLREEAPRKSVRSMIVESVPYWIILVALVLFGLSAPHTKGIFDKLTPGWGWIAPIGIEFGLLYCAFQRRLAKAKQQAVAWTMWTLEILLFVTAMLVNGTGAFVSVVSATDIDSLSFSAIGDEFGNLPATSQAALIMAGLSAFIIPIGTLVAGEGLAALAFEERDTTDHREHQWQQVEFMVTYRAVFVRYLEQGLSEREARQRAINEVRGYIGGRNNLSHAVHLLSAPNGRSEYLTERPNGQGESVKSRVSAYLDANPNLTKLSVNQVHSALKNAGVQAGRTTVGKVLQERKDNE